MHCVESEAVDAVLFQPVQGVVDKELTHVFAALAVEVDRSTPWGLVAVCEELRSIKREVVSLGAEVVVDDIEKDHEALRMRGLYEIFQILRGPVGALRGEWQHAIVAPVAPSRELRERHQLYRCHTEVHEIVELLLDPGECPLGSKGANVQLVEDDLLPLTSLPVLVPPDEGRGVHNPACAVHVIRLVAGGRIWHLLPTVYPVAVACASPGFCGEGEGPVLLTVHREGSIFEDEIYRFGGRCPEGEAGLSILQYLCAEGHIVAPQSASSSTVSRLRAFTSTTMERGFKVYVPPGLKKPSGFRPAAATPGSG